MRSLIRWLALLVVTLCLAAGATGCTREQYLVYILTDAPVPSWGDRVLVEILNDDATLACDDCRRDFTVTAQSFPLTVGVAPPVKGKSVHVRARFFHSSQLGPDGVPHDTNLIDEVGHLVETSASDGPRFKAFMVLTSFCFGIPPTLTPGAFESCANDTTSFRLLPEQDLPVPKDDATFAGLLPGQGTVVSTCDTPPAGMVCVQGKAFLLGDLDTLGTDSDYPAQPLHALQPLQSWYADVDEMTVGTVRKLVAAGKVPADGIAARGSKAGTEACTYLSATNASNDALPINCVDYITAYDVCTALGKELPREDVWEGLAQNMQDESPYPWGTATPTCDRAVLSAAPECMRQGPVAGGAATDVTPAGIRNMGGNVSEWVFGAFTSYSDPCWTQTGSSFYDGECADAVASVSNDGFHGHRGGSYKRRATSAATFARFASQGSTQSPEIGFRCVKALDVSP